MSDWTPGPWRASRFGEGEDSMLVVDGPEEALGDGVAFAPQICERVFSEADARLIAAAPRMAEGLRSLLEAAERLRYYTFANEIRSLLSELNPPPRTPGPGGVGMEIDPEGA